MAACTELWPLDARDGVEGVNVHHADEAVVANHEMAAAAGAEHFGAVFFKRDVAGAVGTSLLMTSAALRPARVSRMAT